MTAFDFCTPIVCLYSSASSLFKNTRLNFFSSWSLNRFLIIEGGSHFSPIRINDNYSKDIKSNDIFKINKSFIGSNPNSVQNLSLKIIVEFLEDLSKNKSIEIMKNQTESNLDFHILDKKTLKEIIKN